MIAACCFVNVFVWVDVDILYMFMYIDCASFMSSAWKSTIHNEIDANSLVAGSTNILQGFVH